jgi:colicin import membrane protein
MKPGIVISCLGHVGVLAWGLVTFAAKPMQAPPAEALPIDFISASQFSQMTAGLKNAPLTGTPKPLADKVAEPKPVKQDAPKAADKPEITTAAAAEKSPPLPEPKPPEKSEKKPEPKVDQIAEQLKKEEAKKPPKPEEKPAPKKPVQQAHKFDADQVAALLDRRDPRRQMAAADALNNAPTLGTSAGNAATLSQSEIDALRAKLISLWNPPAGITKPEDYIIRVRIRLGKDGRLTSPPIVLTSGQGTLFDATRDSAVRAIFRGQPYDMLSPATYDVWKDMEINFDPRDLMRG